MILRYLPDNFKTKKYFVTNGIKIQKIIKRQIDFWLGLVLAVVLSPVFLAIAAAIKLDSRGPVLFRQERPGKNGRGFHILKFRTMTVGADKFGLNMKENNPRITRVGRFLRRWHLDEMPQLFNIIKGQMSFVGPRPPMFCHIHPDNECEQKRFSTLPGLAGWAQLHGGNEISWEQRVAYDVWYVENWSLFLDFRIFFLTFWNVIVRGEGVYQKKDD